MSTVSTAVKKRLLPNQPLPTGYFTVSLAASATSGAALLADGGSPFGSAASSLRVYSWVGAVNICRLRPASTISPLVITHTRLAMLRTMPRSWVMSSMAMFSCACRSLSNCRICAWMVTSSAVVGSSAISNCGSLASAMAIITRWRWPPESSWGYAPRRLSASCRPTSCSSSKVRSRASLAESRLWTTSASPTCLAMTCSGLRDVIGSWKIMLTTPPRTSRSRVLSAPSISSPFTSTLPPGWCACG